MLAARGPSSAFVMCNKEISEDGAASLFRESWIRAGLKYEIFRSEDITNRFFSEILSSVC